MEVVTTTQNVEGRTVNQPWRKIVVTVLELGSETTILAWNSANTGPGLLTELVTVYVARDCPAGIVTYPYVLRRMSERSLLNSTLRPPEGAGAVSSMMPVVDWPDRTTGGSKNSVATGGEEAQTSEPAW